MMIVRLLGPVLAVAALLAASPALGQSSSLFHRGQRGQFGSNQAGGADPASGQPAAGQPSAPSAAPTAAPANAPQAAPPATPAQAGSSPAAGTAPQAQQASDKAAAPAGGSQADSPGQVIGASNQPATAVPTPAPAASPATPVQAVSLVVPANSPTRADPTKPQMPQPYVLGGNGPRDRSLSPAMAALQQVSFTASAPPPPRQFRVHDLVTIIVREETSFASDGETDLDKKASIDAKIEAWFRTHWSNPPLRAYPLGTAPELKASAERKLEGDGSVKRKDTFIGRLTAEVIDVKPNGTLVLAARKYIKTDDEEQDFELSGVCRVDDVTADNTVLSTQLADVTVRKTHRGSVRDTTKRGILPWLADKVNPW